MLNRVGVVVIVVAALGSPVAQALALPPLLTCDEAKYDCCPVGKMPTIGVDLGDVMDCLNYSLGGVP